MVQAKSFDLSELSYPESDGNPMADNTKQYRWIVQVTENLKRLFADQTVFVAADLFWYPVQGQPKIVYAPDILVVMGRPDGDRGSYKQWQEEGIAPQVVFEILSPGNSGREIIAKQAFYEKYGVLEMFFYDPDSFDFWGLVRSSPKQDLSPIGPIHLPWVSPTLGIRFEMGEAGLALFHPGGEIFKNYQELYQERDRAWAKLRELGINPEEL